MTTFCLATELRTISWQMEGRVKNLRTAGYSKSRYFFLCLKEMVTGGARFYFVRKTGFIKPTNERKRG